MQRGNRIEVVGALMVLATAGCRIGPAVGSDGGGATALPVDCRQNSHRQVTDYDIRCAPYSGDTRTVGTGPAMEDLFQDGFVDGSTVVFANGNSLSNVRAIFSLDPTTMVRRIISGTYRDPRTGDTTVGSGPTITDVYDAAKGPDGYYFLVSDSDHPMGTWAGLTHDPVVLRIDPATGNRTEALDFGSDTAACMTRGGKRLYPNGALVFSSSNTDFLSMDVGPDGTIYAGVEGSADDGMGGVHQWGGIAAFNGGHCRLVSVWDSMHMDDVGTGYQLTDAPAGIRVAGGTMYVIPSDAALMQIDLATGNRVILSDDGTGVGMGPPVHTQEIQIAPDGTIWTGGGDLSVTLFTGVDPMTGDRIGANSMGSGNAIGAPVLYGVDANHPWLYYANAEGQIDVLEYTTSNENILAL